MHVTPEIAEAGKEAQTDRQHGKDGNPNAQDLVSVIGCWPTILKLIWKQNRHITGSNYGRKLSIM